MKRILLLLFTASAVFTPVFSEELRNSPIVLTVDKAVELGMKNNYSLKNQAKITTGKERSRKDAWNVFLPDISASMTLSRSNTTQTAGGSVYAGTNNPMDPDSYSAEDGIYDYIAITSFEQEINPWTAVGNISAQLAVNPAMFNGVKQLELDYRNALLDMESAEKNTEKNIKKNFYNLLLLQEQIDVLKKNIETTRVRLVSMEQMYANGYITELDLMNTRAGLSSLGPALLQMENAFEQLKMAFLMDLGMPFDSTVELKGEVDVSPEKLNADDLINTSLADRLDIQQLTIAEEMLVNAKSAAINQNLMPSLVLGWSYSPYQVDPFEAENWGDDGMSGDNGSFSVTVSLPIEDWIPHSASSNRIKEAQDEIDKMSYQKELAFLGAEMEIRSLVMTLNTSIETMKVLVESADINRKSYEMSLKAYNNGQLSLLDLETAENDLLQAETDLVSEKFNYISSLLNLEEAVNKNLSK